MRKYAVVYSNEEFAKTHHDIFLGENHEVLKSLHQLMMRPVEWHVAEQNLKNVKDFFSGPEAYKSARLMRMYIIERHE